MNRSQCLCMNPAGYAKADDSIFYIAYRRHASAVYL